MTGKLLESKCSDCGHWRVTDVTPLLDRLAALSLSYRALERKLEITTAFVDDEHMPALEQAIKESEDAD